MSVASNVPNGYPSAYASSMQAPVSNTSLYGTLTGQPAPASSSIPSAPAATWSTSSNTTPLMRAPQNYAPSGHLKESDDDLLQLSSPPTSNGKQPPNPVILATIPVYLAFIAAVVGGVSLMSLSKTRGREPQFTYSEEVGHLNVKHREDLKTKAFNTALEQHEKVTKGFNYRLKDGSVSGEKPELHNVFKPQLKAGETFLKTLPGFVTAAKSVIENHAWQSKQKITVAGHRDEEIYIGFHGNESKFAGAKVNAAHGIMSIAYPLYKTDTATSKLENALRTAFTAHGLSVEAVHNPAQGEAELHTITDYHGPHKLGYMKVAVAEGDIGHKQMANVLSSLGLKPDELLKGDLHDKGRLAEADERLNTSRSWNDQYELSLGNQSVSKTSEGARKRGAMKFRLSQFRNGYRKGWQDPFESGFRLAHMNQTSVLLTASLVFMTSILAWLVSHEQAEAARKKQAQSI